MISTSMQTAIDKILHSPAQSCTKEEAKKNLQACGILNEDGTVAERYKDIIIKKECK